MKRNLLLILLLLMPCLLKADEQDIEIGQYKWVKSIPMAPCDIYGNPDTTVSNKLSIVGQFFDIVKIEGNDVVLKIVPYSNPQSALIKQYLFNGTTTEFDRYTDDEKKSSSFGDRQLFFKVTVKDVQEYAVNMNRIAGSFTLGVLNYPFKFRMSPQADFAGSFNFGVALGYTFGRPKYTNWAFSIISGYSISNVTIDTASVTRNKEDLLSTNNYSAFSISIGGLITYKSKIQAGIFVGTDYISNLNQKRYDWIYQGKTWLSIGFGYSIFSYESEKTTAKSSQE